MVAKIWFVTGASSGLGRAVVEHALQKGDRVAATLRKPAVLSELSSKYSDFQLLTVELDVTLSSDIKTAFATAVEHFGRIDIVYNNAGYIVLGELEGTPEEVARAQFDVNLWGAVNVAKEAVRVFRDVNKPSGGRLLQASSLAGIWAAQSLGFYASSKFALEAISESLSKEVRPSWNIKVTILQLGAFATGWKAPDAMVNVPQLPAYTADADSPTTGFREYFTKKLPLGDATKAAREIFNIAHDDTVPLRVPVGQDAIVVIRRKVEELESILSSTAQWSADLKL